MLKKTILAVAVAATTLGAIGVSTQAVAANVTVVTVAPPAPRAERAPAPRRGYVWAPGYWDYNGRSYVWRTGHWERERAGFRYARSEWVQVGDHYERRGGWSRGDRDGDGVANRYDARPNNPHRN